VITTSKAIETARYFVNTLWFFRRT